MRWDQECSQYFTAQRMRQEVNSREQMEIPIEDLRRVIVATEENEEELITETTGSPLSWEIREAKLLEGFKLPIIKAYEEKSDPQDYLDHFNDLIELHLVSEMAKYKVFIVTLTNGAKKWLKAIAYESITSW